MITTIYYDTFRNSYSLAISEKSAPNRYVEVFRGQRPENSEQIDQIENETEMDEETFDAIVAELMKHATETVDEPDNEVANSAGEVDNSVDEVGNREETATEENDNG